MCGICGEVSFDGATASLSTIQRMSEVMAPRGPDASGAVAQSNVAFGHRRLRIIDLSAKGQQPMTDANLGLTLVFNGCIYNYRDLKAELTGLGHQFFSTSDSEVILKAYAEWGADCVTRFNGMFAFAIHERDSGRVVLARDRLGIKPLYVAILGDGKTLRFASSLPAILAGGGIDTGLDPIALHHYLTFHAVVPPPLTILKGVRKLPPATITIIEPDGRRSDRTYWSPRFDRDAGDVELPETQWRDRVRASLETAVKRRMIADVPVGVLLSGGVDSSLIVGLLANAGQEGLKTFSIGFEDEGGESGNEFAYSDIISRTFATEHHRIVVGSDRMIGALPDVIHAMSEPMVSHDNVGFYLLSQEVSKHVKVVQSGQGADEIFGGYHWYPPLANSNDAVGDYRKAFFDRTHEEFQTVVDAGFAGADYSTEFVTRHFAQPGAGSAVDRALRIDTLVMLTDDPVKRVDNMTMAFGLEARVPFLDHTLVELAARIPSELKLKDGGKGILKDVARQVIPSEVIDRPKGYFPVPALKYITGTVLEMVRDTLNSSHARHRNLFNRSYIDMLIDDPGAHITPLRGSKLWQVALLEMWLQTHAV